MAKDYVPHLDIKRADINGAEIALLPGDPDRVPILASQLSNAREIAYKREFRTFLGEAEGIPVLVSSTGVGAPSTSVCVEELAQLGVGDFIRVGTTGSIQERIEVGDKIISIGAVRLEGASRNFAPIEFPAVADLEITNALVASAQEEGSKYHVGIGATTDNFYQGQERYDTFSGFVPAHLRGSLKEWAQLGVLNFEMETALLFTMCATMGLRAGALCGVVAQRTEAESFVDAATFEKIEAALARIATNAVQILEKSS